MKTNGGNERLKRRYFEYLRESRQLNERSIEAEAKALDRFEIYSGWRDFGRFKTDLAVAFKRHLAKQTNGRTGEILSKATVYSTLTALQKFFSWLSHQPGYRKRISETDADYFKASLKDRTTAKSVGVARVPSLDQIQTAFAAMPDHTSVEKRDRAIVALAILTGARDDAIASLRIEHLDLDEERLFQDGRQVRTKFGKTIEAFFFPVGDDFTEALRVWVEHLRNVEGFKPSDPLFPPIKTGLGDVSCCRFGGHEVRLA